ncbi:DUF4129 domain-containing transglutaminase family protein [Desmospora profundinema]|uniref:Transglutaminase-like domain-containing protein n=1 Tax=Desmospora profundinema TaxID=1571184 RepID=A0ABU1IRW7_9BACL|nr:transglutaminase domain-containing protein [Desmospora profundinema]MDR6227490.1 hypothetical protein [Desmospora profundinema]
MAENIWQTSNPPSRGRGWGLSVLVTLLVWECLLPFSEIEGTDRVDVFFLAFLLLLILQLLFQSAWVRLPLSALVLGGMLYVAHFAKQYPFLDWIWLQEWMTDVAQGWSVWWGEQGWIGPPSFHTFWFLLSLWGLSILFRIWALERGRIFPFIIGAVIALSILDSFTPYDASSAILRVFVYSFVALAWLRLSQLREQSAGEPPPARGWTLLAALLILSAVGTGWMAPKPEASWPNPAAWIQSGDERAGGGPGFRRIGYSRDDSRLGGSLLMNEDVVIEAFLETPYYWRGESRDLYTGKGWQNTLQPEDQWVFPENGGENEDGYESVKIDSQLFQNVSSDENRVFSLSQRGYPVLFTPGQLKRIHFLEPAAMLLPQPEHGGFITAQHVSLERYGIEAKIPRINEEDLRGTGGDYPREITDIYLQLPDSLPDRVRELAREVGGGEDNPYDAVKAVEGFLRREGGYTYELDEVPIPGDGDDFVDQFLFDSKQGYCDHFSTSMVVMLRSLDIPARWVKGFAPGNSERVSDDKVLKAYDTEELYQVNVKNSNAHSWVEVYFEDRGWIPFEPTPGFSNPTPIDWDVDSADDGTDSGVNDTDTTVGGSDSRDPQLEQDPNQSEGADASEGALRWQPWAWGAGLMLSAMGFFIWFLRYRLLWWWYQRSPSSDDSIFRAYRSLLRWLSWYQGPRRPHQTLREYVLERDWLSQPSDELRELTCAYEESRYGKGEPGLKERTWQLWKRVMEQFRPS